MLEVSLNSQTLAFLCSILNGLIIGVVYTFFKCIRVALKNSKAVTFVCDVCFMLFFTFVTMIFSIGFTLGFVRYFVVAGEIVGLVAYKFTLGRLFDTLFNILFRAFGKFCGAFQKNIKGFIKKLLKARHKMLYNKDKKKTILKGEREYDS